MCEYQKNKKTKKQKTKDDDISEAMQEKNYANGMCIGFGKQNGGVAIRFVSVVNSYVYKYCPQGWCANKNKAELQEGYIFNFTQNDLKNAIGGDLYTNEMSNDLTMRVRFNEVLYCA